MRMSLIPVWWPNRRKATLLGRDVSRRSLRHVVKRGPADHWRVLLSCICTCVHVCYVCVCLVCGYAHTLCAQVIRAYWTRLDAHMTKWSSTRCGRVEESRRTWFAGLRAKGKIFPVFPESRANEHDIIITVIPSTYVDHFQGVEEPHRRTSFMYMYMKKLIFFNFVCGFNLWQVHHNIVFWILSTTKTIINCNEYVFLHKYKKCIYKNLYWIKQSLD